jgi:hypothetical protein
VSSGFKRLVTNVEGSAGGVRTAVAEGTGVSLGRGDAVGCNCANAVWNAWVNAAFISGVVAEAGWQALNKIRIKIGGRKRRINFCMEVILSEKGKTTGWSCRRSYPLLSADEGFHFFAADIVAELFGRGLEEVGRRSDNGATEFAIQCDLRRADGIDHDASRLRAIS